jgi:hypothetical protein
MKSVFHACLGAMAIAIGSCGPRRLSLGSETVNAGDAMGTEADLQAGGLGGSLVSIPVGSQDAGATAALGQHCAVDADCAAPQVCAQGRCHATCSPSVGCKQGHHLFPCLTTFAKMPVCPLPCDQGWGQDSSLCVRAGEADDGPRDLYACPTFPTGRVCVYSESSCSTVSCSEGGNTLRQDCDHGVCNCTYNFQLACRCVTTDPPSFCSYCCQY